MSARKETAAIVGVGAAACAACCAGPVVGFLAAVGLGTGAAVALFGMIGLAIVAIGAVVFLHRRRQDVSGRSVIEAPVAVEMPTLRTPR